MFKSFLSPKAVQILKQGQCDPRLRADDKVVDKLFIDGLLNYEEQINMLVVSKEGKEALRWHPFNPEHAARFAHAANQTWDQIGGDTLNAVAAERRVNPNRVELSGKHVREIVADSDHIATFSGDNDIVKWFEDLPRRQQEMLLKLALPFKHYGW